jgi:hypothetical protein
LTTTILECIAIMLVGPPVMFFYMWFGLVGVYPLRDAIRRIFKAMRIPFLIFGYTVALLNVLSRL